MIKAVVVGINAYKNFPDQNLNGCINDADDVLGYLTELGTDSANITPLYDQRATKTAIVEAIRDMIASSTTGDHLLLHFSGHGTQMEADAITEPDGLDEVLCPTDFNFSDRTTALTDDEIAAMIRTLPAGVGWTLVVDACHSGDLTRDLAAKTKPRFLRPPTDVAWRLRDRTLVDRKRALSSAYGVSVSACTSAETAADTSFDKRPNGAFTYHWLRTLKATPEASLDALVKTVGEAIESFKMHPEVQGSSVMRGAAFLATVPKSRSMGLTKRSIPMGQRTLVVYETQWMTSVMGLPVSLGLRVLQSGPSFVFEITPSVAGMKFTVPVAVDGNVSIPIPVTMIGQVIIDVGGWSLTSTRLDCDVSARIAPAFPFVPPVTLARRHLAIPLRTDDRAFAPQTAAELYAMLELMRGSMTPPASAPRIESARGET